VFKKHSAVAQRNNSGNRRRYHGAIILLMEPTCGRIWTSYCHHQYYVHHYQHTRVHRCGNGINTAADWTTAD